MLHAGGKRCHAQVVGSAHGMEVTRKVEGIRRKGNALRQPAPGSRPLHAHGGAAGGLTNGRRRALTTPGQALHQTYGRGGFSFAKRRGRDGRDIDVFAIGAIFQTTQHSLLLNLAHIVPVGQQFRAFKAQFGRQGFNGFHTAFRILSDFPVRVLGGI